MTNTIVAGNSATCFGPDIASTITRGGHNLFGTTSGTTISGGSGDLLNVNAQLGSLSSNGGTDADDPPARGLPRHRCGRPERDGLCLDGGEWGEQEGSAGVRTVSGGV